MEYNTRPLWQQLLIPAAILLGFALVAAAIYLAGVDEREPASTQTAAATATSSPTAADNAPEEDTGDLSAVKPVTEDDHIRGPRDARITFIEYSDYDCPFCKRFHDTMRQIMAEYGDTGEVAWVYRHFPLTQLHPNAIRIAMASECVASLGGNDAFWQFSDFVFDERGINDATEMSALPDFAARAGVDRDAFTRCLDNEETRAAVDADYQNAITIGGRGTPYTVVLVDDQQLAISGARAFADLQNFIEQVLGTTPPAAN